MVRGGQLHTLAALAAEREPIPILQDIKWASGQFWEGAENLTSTGMRSSDHPARSESLHTLHSAGPLVLNWTVFV
jgi:hypothetical protein